jgi:hypothetical protein
LIVAIPVSKACKAADRVKGEGVNRAAVAAIVVDDMYIAKKREAAYSKLFGYPIHAPRA